MIKLHQVILSGYKPMTRHVPKIATTKNEWLYQQVDVEFPTKESLTGRELYKTSVAERNYVNLANYLADHDKQNSFSVDDIYLVDFHRLTVLFSLLQSKRWANEEEQQFIVEFLTQIIYSEPCQLYLGFKDGEPMAAAIVTQSDEELLVSDVTLVDPALQASFIHALVTKNETSKLLDVISDAYLEI
nr:flavodoxin [Vibrio panuliri]